MALSGGPLEPDTTVQIHMRYTDTDTNCACPHLGRLHLALTTATRLNVLKFEIVYIWHIWLNILIIFFF